MALNLAALDLWAVGAPAFRPVNEIVSAWGFSPGWGSQGRTC